MLACASREGQGWATRAHRGRPEAASPGEATGDSPSLAQGGAGNVCVDATKRPCVVAYTVVWARGYGLCSDDVFRRYVSTVSKRPAFAAAFADAREFTPDATGRPLSAHFTG